MTLLRRLRPPPAVVPAAPLAGAAAVVVTDAAAGLSDLVGWWREQGGAVVRTRELAQAEALLPASGGWLVVDVDAMGGIEALIEPLMAWRCRRPGTVVILVSARFLRDEAEPHRTPVCDLTLSRPVRLSRLAALLPEAAANAADWAARARLTH